MATIAPTAGAEPALGGRTRGVWGDRVFRAVTLGAGVLVLAILALIAYATAAKAWPAFKHQGFSFVTSTNWDPNNNQFGALDFIYGTLVVSAIALTLAIPFSLGIALFTTELASKHVRMAVTYVVDLLAAIPSVVYGYWAYEMLTTPASHWYKRIADTVGHLPLLGRLFGGPVTGQSFMTAGLILAVMVTPIITSLSREVLLTVRQDDKNAALAMGATRWEMLRVAVFPRVRPGLVGAVMLGLGRALGETIAVALVIGANHELTSHLFRTGDSMASVIAHNFGEATDLYRSALVGLGVVLFALTIAVNFTARAVTRRTMRGTVGGV